jgi:transcriptional regulator GlxA family with amidase domain
MLTEENYSIAQIATKCGFKESSHFGRVFRDSTGLTPKQYRRKKQNLQ